MRSRPTCAAVQGFRPANRFHLWAPGATAGKTSKTVLRAGFGIFYDRFALSNILAAARYNGVIQQQYVIDNPTFFPDIPSIASLAAYPASTQAIREIDSHLQAPYLMQSAFTVERQLPWKSTLAVTYSNSQGLHEIRSYDMNAPLAGTITRAMERVSIRIPGKARSF